MSKRGPHAASHAITDEEIENRLRLLVTDTAVPEGDRLAWTRSLERYAHQPRPEGYGFDMRKVAGAFLRIASSTWDAYPPQETEACAGVRGIRPRDPEPPPSLQVPRRGSRGR